MRRSMREEIINTVTFTSRYSKFKGDSWQQAYFYLLSWKNTWYKTISLDINSTYKHEAFLEVVVKEKDAESVKGMLEDLGYGEIKEYKGKLLKLFVEWDGDEDYDEVIAEFD
jgi:hypothetical protein